MFNDSMLALFVLVIFGLGMAFFATQNTGVVHIMLGSYFITGIPLYVIVIGSMLFGIFVSWVISLVDRLSSSFTIHGKESEIKKSQQTIDILQKEKHDLEIENSRLKGEVKQEEVENINKKPSLLQSFKHNVGY